MRGLSNHAVVARPNASVTTASVSPRRRRTGSPISVGERGADEPGAEQPEREVPARAGGDRRADRRADRHERHLPEADLAGPPGQHDERQRDHAVDDRDRGEVGAALAEHDRHEREARAPRARAVRRRRSAPRGGGPAPAAPGVARAPPATPTARCVPRSPAPGGVNHTATSTTTKSTGCTSLGWFQPHSTDCSTMPSPMAATAIVGSRSMRPMTAAARAGRSSDGPSTVPIDNPTMPARRNTARNAEHDGEHPHDGVHAPHRDADERGAVDVVGAGAHRHARAGCAGTPRARGTRAGSATQSRPRRCRRSAAGRR